MEPYANKFTRTSNGLQFGAPPATSTYIGDLPSQSVYSRSRPATASPTLQRASIQDMCPHLDKKLVLHQTEIRYIGVDYSKPPAGGRPLSPAHEATKKYSLYSRPYGHVNTSAAGPTRTHGHGLFTQSIQGPSHLSSTARPHTAGPTIGAGVAGHNASVASLVSWGQPLPDQPERGDTQSQHSGQHSHRSQGEGDGSRAESSGKVSRDPSRDSEESGCEFNYAPRFDGAVSVSTPPGKTTASVGSSSKPAFLPTASIVGTASSPMPPHYLLPKSLPAGHKALIGKQRAAPERAKLTRNRPLASPDGYKIYST